MSVSSLKSDPRISVCTPMTFKPNLFSDIHAIQQKLTAIAAGREVSLDIARQYFELMLLPIEEILSGIVENGPQFQHQEYK